MHENTPSNPDIPLNEICSKREEGASGVVLPRLEQLRVHVIGSQCRKRSVLSRYGLALHARVVEQLHHKTSRRNVPVLPTKPSASTIFQRISAGCMSLKIASVIRRSLTAFARSRDTQIKALRCSTVYWFTDEKTPWPVVEWIENNDTNNLAIFHFGDPDEPEQGSWLMHSGLIIVDEISKKRRWENSRIDWNVAEINDLKTLFGVAQHISGMLEWSVEDAKKLYCKQNIEEEPTPPEYIPFTDPLTWRRMTRQAKLLYNHVLQIKLLDAAFDKISLALQVLCQEDGELLLSNGLIYLDAPGESIQQRLGMSLYL